MMTLRGHEDVYDLSWAPDAAALLSGSTDCSARVWDVLHKGRTVQTLTDHRHYVQGEMCERNMCTWGNAQRLHQLQRARMGRVA